MPFHVKTPSILNPAIGDIYYVDENHWTENYDDRKVFSDESEAIDVTTHTVTNNGIIYAPSKNANATVVSE
tara:strand:+ start:31 stop:243 length:213 start_codon:yes stop_codon:yes gene_type:complete